jgi:hypothetical protein
VRRLLPLGDRDGEGNDGLVYMAPITPHQPDDPANAVELLARLKRIPGTGKYERCASPSAIEERGSMVDDVSPRQVWEALRNDAGAELVDVRTEAEWSGSGCRISPRRARSRC